MKKKSFVFSCVFPYGFNEHGAESERSVFIRSRGGGNTLSYSN